MRRNQFTRRHVIQAGAATAGVMFFPARAGVGAQDNIEITFWNSTLPIEDPSDKTKKLEDFYVYQAIDRFQEANPNVSVKIETFPGGSELFTKFRTASVAKNGPCVMGLWSGTYLLALKDFIEPVGSYMSDEERAQLTGWEAVNEAFDPNAPADQLYGVPAGTDGVTAVFYNNALLKEAGVDPQTKWVTNVDEFYATLDAIAATGVTPLVLEHNAIIWQILLYWIGQTVGGAPGINALASGERNFSDPELVDIVTTWQRLADYTIPGAETMKGDASFQLFAEEQAAMTTGGAWVIDDGRGFFGDDFGMIGMPDYSADAPITGGGIGGPGAAFIVSNYCEHKDEAFDFVKFLMSPDELVERASSGEGQLVNLVGIDAAEIYDEPLMVTQQEWAVRPSTIFWADNIMPAELTTELQAQSELAWTGDIDAQTFMERADAKRDEILGR